MFNQVSLSVIFKGLNVLVSIPKSFVYCCYIFGFVDGIKLPIIFHFRTKIKIKRGSIQCNGKRIFFGFGGTEGVNSNKQSFFIIKEGLLFFKGRANFGAGSSIRIDSGRVEIGDEFLANKNIFIYIKDALSIGSNVIVGWNCDFRDNDGHTIKGTVNSLGITIGNHCWISSECLIVKGVKIGEECVIGSRSLVTRTISKKNVPQQSVIVGSPARIVKKNIEWLN